MDHFTQGAGFVIVTYFVATPDKHVMAVSCTVRGNPSTMGAARIARRDRSLQNLRGQILELETLTYRRP